ncbi:beta strand repeat-containing protein, partial [Helicobacter brantae]
GENNQLTSVSSTTSGTLSLDGASNENGVSASVLSAIVGNTTTLNFNGANGKKAEMTLGDGGNELKAITLGSNAVENKLILTQGDTSIESAVNVGANQALAFDLANGTTLALSQGLSSSNGGTSLFNVKDSASSTINGNITLSNNGVNNATIGNNGTLTLQGENNQLTSVSSTTSGTLSLDGASNENGVSASVSNAITGNSTTLNFNGANGKKAEMTLDDGGNELKAITLGDSATNNKLILSTGSTSVTEGVNVGANQALAFDLGDGVNLALVGNLANAGESEINFNGSNGILISSISTTAGATTIKIAEDKSGVIQGAISTTDGATNVNFAGIGTLTLQGENNQLTSVTSTTSGTLSLDGASNENGVSASVLSAIVGNTTTLNFNGANGKKAEMTLSDCGNFLKAITLGSNAVENKLILTQGDTSIESAVNVGASQALTFDLGDGVNLILADNLANAGESEINFNGSNGILISSISTTAGATTIKIAEDKSGVIQGAISTTDGATNVNFAGVGTLTLQGENNQLTSVSSTTSGILSLNGAGVSASVSNAIIGNSTTLDFNGRTGKKAEMTLNASGNFLKAITLGSNAVENKLILSQGDTSIQSNTTITTGQALTFDLKDGVNLINTISNIGGNTNLEFNGINGTFTGTLSTSGGATTIKITESKSGTITGAVTTDSGAITTIDFSNGSNVKSL